jgi:hypothetical protein
MPVAVPTKVGGGHHLGAQFDARGLQRDANRDGAIRAGHGVSLDAALRRRVPRCS